MPGAIGRWLRNRARGVKKDHVPQSHNVASQKIGHRQVVAVVIC
tara:strand:- start:161 stop:292 length:132 start_codon:yes stop_codon:yes gene_type:complete